MAARVAEEMGAPEKAEEMGAVLQTAGFGSADQSRVSAGYHMA